MGNGTFLTVGVPTDVGDPPTSGFLTKVFLLKSLLSPRWVVVSPKCISTKLSTFNNDFVARHTHVHWYTYSREI